VDFLIQAEDGTMLRAKKSWFFVGDAIVALGSDISCTGSGEVETVVRQVALSGGDPVGEESKDIVGLVADPDCVYLFPDANTVRTYVAQRSGRWSEINLRSGRVSADEQSRNFAFAIISHGVQPKGEGYAVIYLPGATIEGANGWWAGKPLEIVQQDGEAHVIRDLETGKTLSVRWGVGAGVGV
jgi:hyaluronate lyase